MARTKLLLFDFDGTLVDTAPDLVTTTNLLLKSYGHEPLAPAAVRAEIGYGLKSLLRDTIPEALEDPAHMLKVERDFLDIYETEMLRSPTIFDGALEFLKEWPGKIAIVSNKRIAQILLIAKKLKLDQLPWTSVIGGDSFETMKPTARPFLEAMKAAGIGVAETLMIGDGEPDIEGATALGMRSVAVSFGYSKVEKLVQLGASATIGHYSELKNLIHKFDNL
jgi:phosphoglycolate phosphatase